ncbi:MAG: recombinase family protein, partial [Candidatus Eisenbacteria bacterium]|nr:recombinase family protein [Candidatus Eisenbacteria bacterium]
MNAVLYIRVSTKEQAEQGYSLSAQARLLIEYAERKAFRVTRKFMVPESASGKQERKTFLEMLEFLRSNPETKLVLCEKVDRITRNFKDAVKLDDWLNEDEARQLHFVKQNLVIHKNSKSYDKFQWDIYLVLARQYSNNLSEEARKGLEEKAVQGWYPGNHKKGYKAIGSVGRKTWVIDSSPNSEAPFVRRAFELYDTGEHTIDTLRRKLFEEGWKTKAGTPISKTEMHNLLTDCFYCGEFDWKEKHFPQASHPPLISKELFYSVQERIRRKLTGKYRKHDKFLFKDLIKCGECGRSVVAQVQKGHHYYRCTHYGTNCSQRGYVREEELEKQVICLLDGLEVKNTRIVDWIRKALKESHAQEAQYHDVALAELNRQFTIIQKRLDALYDDKLDGKITDAMYEKKFQQCSQEQDNILGATRRHKEANISYFELGANIFELSQKAR